MGCQCVLDADVVVATRNVALADDLRFFAVFHQNTCSERCELVGDALLDSLCRVGDKDRFDFGLWRVCVWRI